MLSPTAFHLVPDVWQRWKSGTAGEGGELLEVVRMQFLMYLFLGMNGKEVLS